jgi:putative transposase
MKPTWAQRWGVEPRPGRRRPASPQRTLAEAPTRGRGGVRAGAGRKPKDGRTNVRHARRPPHSRWVPVHVTLRRAKGLPSLRSEVLHAQLKAVIRRGGREGFRIVEYSVQHDHVHLIVEAEDRKVLSGAMRSFAIRASRSVNRGLRRRRGRVWGDRYHRHDLGSPPEVRHALVYVLANGVKHGVVPRGVMDPCSSAPWFEGWVNARPRPREPSITSPAETWLLRTGWTTTFPGYIFPSEVPEAARRPAS